MLFVEKQKRKILRFPVDGLRDDTAPMLGGDDSDWDFVLLLKIVYIAPFMLNIIFWVSF